MTIKTVYEEIFEGNDNLYFWIYQIAHTNNPLIQNEVNELLCQNWKLNRKRMYIQSENTVKNQKEEQEEENKSLKEYLLEYHPGPDD